MATLRQRGQSWQLEWILGGRRGGARQAASFKGPTPEVAFKLAEIAQKLVESRGHRMTRDEVLARVLETDDTPPGMPTLAEWVKAWVDDRTPVRPDHPGVDEIQLDTLIGYIGVLNLRVLPHMGHLLLSEIDEEAVRDWVRWLKATRVRRTKSNPAGRPISAQSVRRAHGVLHQVLGAAVPKWIARNPAARPLGSRKNRVGLPKVAPYEAVFLTPQEVERIHACCPPAMKDLFFVLVRTGLRLGEALVLRVQDVTLDGNDPEIRVRRALKKGQRIGQPKSAKSRREVEISDDVVALLRERCKGKRPSDLLFPSTEGKVWRENNLRQRHWLPAVAAAQRCEEHPPSLPPKKATGPRRNLRPDEVSVCDCPQRLKRTPRMHDARHFHASWLIKDGWNATEIQHRLGHASHTTTMNVYGHLWKGGKKDRLNSAERGLAILEDEDA